MNSSNKTMKWLFLIAISLATLILWNSASVADEQTHQTMKFKLHYAQGILEGITTENFELIATNAFNLKKLSQASGWEIRHTADYQRFTAEFRQHTESLSKAAEHRNVDAATVAYFQLTVSCVNCHKYLREARVAIQKPLERRVGL